jgi:glycerol-3-phosphate acyltransferase PlsX
LKKIAFDVMGNDNGIVPCINAVLNFLKINNDYFFYLVGKKQKILKYIKENKFIKIIDAKEIKDKNISPRTLKNSNFSMTMAIKLVKEKKADIVISSGDSGLYLSLTTLILNRINGVKRSAFMPIFPTIQKNKKFIMMDVGANILTTKEMIVQ